MGSTILVIEDGADIVELLRYNLERERYRVLVETSGEDGLKAAQSQLPDLILLDLGLPGLGGLEICRRLKSNPLAESIPIIMITARGEESDVILGLEMGADDYVSKPFRIRELIARVRAVLRRAPEKPAAEPEGAIQVGPIHIDPVRYEVRVNSDPVDLTLAEFRLLKTLAAQPGRVFSRDQLLDRITDGKAVIIDRNVDVHIRSIRKKLGEARSLISTVRGIGYKLVEPRFR